MWDVSAAEVEVRAAWAGKVLAADVAFTLRVLHKGDKVLQPAKGGGLTLFQVWLHRQDCSSPSGRSTRQGTSTLAGDTGTAMASCTQLRSGRTRSGPSNFTRFPDSLSLSGARLVCHCHSGQACHSQLSTSVLTRARRGCHDPCSPVCGSRC